MKKKTCWPRFSESKDSHSRVGIKYYTVIRNKSKFFSCGYCPRAGKICYFRPLLHNVLVPRTETENATIPFLRQAEMWYFGPGVRKTLFKKVIILLKDIISIIIELKILTYYVSVKYNDTHKIL